MQIDIHKMAQLAKLTIPDDKLVGFTNSMNEIVQMVENLPDVKTGANLPLPLETMQLREDAVEPSYTRQEILQNAPQTKSGCFVVPKIVG